MILKIIKPPQLCQYLHTVASTAVSRQRFSKHTPAEMDTHAKIEAAGNDVFYSVCAEVL
jgi:hypothetical protein